MPSASSSNDYYTKDIELGNITTEKSVEIGERDEEINSGKFQELGDESSFDIQGNVRDTEVKRALKQRHITMIALGGTIGTGLWIGTSTPLSDAGPVNALIAYLFMASFCYSVTQSLGEMATFIPVTSSFTVFSKRFLSPALGAANGYMYWFSWCITYALELSVVGQIIQYWTHAVPLAAWIGIFWVILSFGNLIPVKFYGEIEFWVASIKVIAILGFLIYALVMVCGGGKQGPIGFRYWRNPGPWGPGILVSNKAEGRFLGWVSSLINAAFTYQGTELAGVTAGESKNPRKSVPSAINKVFFRILFFYILSLFFVGLLVPFNDPKLTSDDSYVSASPFIIAIQNSGTPVLPHIFNAVILITIISAGNSNVYIGSRVLYGLALSNLSPKCFAWTTKAGVPYVSVMFTSLFGLLGFLVVSNGGNTVFNWLLNITAVAGLFAWLFILISHIRFMQAIRHRGMTRDELPFKAAFMPYSAYYAAFFIIVIILINGFSSFIGGFHTSDFFTAYISVIIFFALWIGFQIWFRGPLFLPIDQVDIDTDRREIDAIVWEEEAPANLWEKFWAILA